MPDLSL
jgi:hypothetical protein